MLYSVEKDKIASIIPDYSADLVIETIGEYNATMQTDAEVLVRIGLACKAQTILEIGTSFGNTAKLLAHYFDRVYTLDNALHEFGGHGDRTGEVCRDIENVTQIIGNSLNPESYASVEEPVDLVFVDDGHDYHHVVTNTFIATKLLAPDGIVVQHDTYWESVMQALTDLATVFDVWFIEETYLAILKRRHEIVRDDG